MGDDLIERLLSVSSTEAPYANETVLAWCHEAAADLARLRAENEALRTDLAIANRGGLDLLYAIRGAIGWTDKHGLSLMPAECARLYRAAKKNAPIWPGRGYDHSQSGGFDGPTGAD